MLVALFHQRRRGVRAKESLRAPATASPVYSICHLASCLVRANLIAAHKRARLGLQQREIELLNLSPPPKFAPSWPPRFGALGPGRSSRVGAARSRVSPAGARWLRAALARNSVLLVIVWRATQSSALAAGRDRRHTPSARSPALATHLLATCSSAPLLLQASCTSAPPTVDVGQNNQNEAARDSREGRNCQRAASA